MNMKLNDVTRIASEVLRKAFRDVELIAVTGEGGGEYAEVILDVPEGRQTPGRIAVGVPRSLPEDEMRARFAAQLHGRGLDAPATPA